MLKIIFLSSIFYLFSSSICHASGLTITPPFQDILASGSANVSYHNQSDQPITLDFSLQQIIATDLLGRLQFNAPLPQTLQNIDPNLAIINPKQLTLNPDEIATVSTTFNPNLLNPGTTAFLLLANVITPTESLPQNPSTNLNQYLGSSILVTAIGGHTTHLELVKPPLSSLPFHFFPPDFLQLTLKNTGNTRSIPKGVILTKDIWGREVLRGAINSESTTILPGSQRLIYGRLQPSLKTWPISIHTLTLTGSDDVGQSSFSYSKTYLYLNLWVLSGIIVIVIIFVIIKKKK